MKTGLVLEGGGIRGIFTAGILDVLMEEGIEFDGAVGVSAGAAFGSNYKSGQSRRAIRYNLRFAKDPRYSSIRSLLATGNLFNAQFCYHDIPEKHDPFDWETFYKNPMEFYLVATDVETGKAVYHRCDKTEGQFETLEWFRASGSMPLVSRVVEVGGCKLLDGGIADSIPLRFMEEHGYERNLVILTRPADYVKKPNPLMPVIRRALSSYPEAVRAIGDRHIFYNQELAYVRQREAGKYAFVIRPEGDLDIGRIEHDRFKIRTVYKEGRRLARRNLSAIRRFLAAAKTEPCSTSGSIIKTEPAEETKAMELLRTQVEETSVLTEETSVPAEEISAPVKKEPEPVKEIEVPVEKAPEPEEVVSVSAEKAPEPEEVISVSAEKAPEPEEMVSVSAEKAPEPEEVISVSAEKTPEPAEKAFELTEEASASEEKTSAPVKEPVPAQPDGISLQETVLPAEETSAEAFTDTAPGEKDKAQASDGSAGNTFILRTSRGNRPGKKWKPGKLTSLKNKCYQNNSSDAD